MSDPRPSPDRSPSYGSPSTRPSSGPHRAHRAAWNVGALAVTLVVALVVAGCGLSRRSTEPSPPASVDSHGVVHVGIGSSTQTIQVDGRSRTFRVYRPATLSSTAAGPLVVMLHGGYGNSAEAESQYGWDEEADRQGFVVAYPNGVNKAWNVGGGCCGRPAQEGIDDVAFVTKVVTTVEGELPVDHRRIYATGISNGGLMAYRLACDTDLFAAIGPDSATLMGSCDHPARVSVLAIHGLADDRIPFDGGKGTGFASVVDGPAVPTVVATWRQVDGCADPVTTTAGAVTRSMASCPDGRTVGLITIAGAGHQWPGGKPPTVVGRAIGLDQPSTALDATDTFWAFFAAHPKP
jgi:polyhydroxybutyrate depolymerase